MKNRMTVLWCIIIWCLSVFQYNVILSFSSAPAAVSSVDSRAVAGEITKVLDAVSNKKDVPRKKLELSRIHHLTRKLAHIVLFFTYAFLNVMFFYLASGGDFVKSFALTLIIGLCGASGDECLQLFVEGRSGQISDIFVDFIGICCGCLNFFAVMKWKRVLKYKGVVL